MLRLVELHFKEVNDQLCQYNAAIVLYSSLAFMNITTRAEREALATNGFYLHSDSSSEEKWSAALSQGSSSWVSITRTAATISVAMEQGAREFHYPMATFPPSHKTWLWSVLDIHRDIVDTMKLNTDD